VVVLSLLGCGGSALKESLPGDALEDRADAVAAAPIAGEPRPEQKPERAAGLPRKIIYNADLWVVVKDVATAEERLRQLVKEHGGFVAAAESSGASGSRRTGMWKVRLPADRLEDFVAAAQDLGVPERSKRDSQDVTEEYYDLEDRIKNKKAEQEALRGYLADKKATSKLEEILAVERELSRVRGELDGMEGKLRRLRDLSALATVTVHLQEIRDYVPPQAPTFRSRAGTVLADSFNLLVRFGEGVALLAVALVPWLPLLAVAGLIFGFIGRRFRRRDAARREIPSVEAVSDEDGPEVRR
jgi:hypothetical protein